MKLSRRHRKSHAGSHLLKDTRSRQTNGRAEEEAGLRLAMYCCRLETLGLEVWGAMIFMMVEIQKDFSLWVQMIVLIKVRVCKLSRTCMDVHTVRK